MALNIQLLNQYGSTLRTMLHELEEAGRTCGFDIVVVIR